MWTRNATRFLSFILLIAITATLAPPRIVSAAPSVNLRDGDARKFSDPPNAVAYANTTQYSSPPEFTITTSGTIWRYYQWIALQGTGSWVNASINVATNNAGVQFWGDNNDGWARVLVDGVEVWKGNTYGADGNYPGNAFVKYLEITGLTSGTHSIKVENLGIGGAGASSGSDVTILFFGMKKSVATSPASSASGLVAYYPFDGDTRDKSGNGYDGTNNGAMFVSGVSGQALSFDGKDDYVSAKVNINPDVMPRMTITAWARANKETGTVISHDNGGYDRTIDIDDRGGGLGWSCFSGGGGVLGYRKVNVSEWTFIAAVYDQPVNNVRLHVNDSVFEESGTLYSGWDSINIGRNPSFGGYFAGAIDEVRIYNYALSASEIAALRSGVTPTAPTPAAPPAPTQLPSSPGGLVAYYPFDGDFNDRSGNGNHGIPKGNMSLAPGVMGQAASFDGKSWIEVNDSGSLDLTTALTFSVWLNKTDSGAGGWAVVLSKGDTSALDNNSPYALAHTSDGLSLGVRFVKNNTYSQIDSNARVDFKKWCLVTVTWDGSDVRYYVDAVLKDTRKWAGVLPISSAKLLIGCDPPGWTEYFRGMMDDLRIYNRALTQSEIEALRGGTTVAPTPTPAPLPTLTPAPPPVVTPAPAPAGASNLVFESRSRTRGSTVQIPLTLKGAKEKIGNIDLTLSYNPAIVQATEATKGSLTSNSMFDFSIRDGTIRISLADKVGFSDDGSLAYVNFKVIGAEGSTSPLRIVDASANRASDFAPVSIFKQDGTFTVVSVEQLRMTFTVLDALRALQVAVGKLDVDLALDVTQDGRVTSADARRILQMAVGTAETPPPAVVSPAPTPTTPPPASKVEVASHRELSPEEFSRSVAGDTAFADIRAFASEQGYTQQGAAVEVKMTDGTVLSGLSLKSSGGQTVVALRITDGTNAASTLVRYEPEKVIFYNREGRLEADGERTRIFDATGNPISRASSPRAMLPGFSWNTPQITSGAPALGVNQCSYTVSSSSLAGSQDQYNYQAAQDVTGILAPQSAPAGNCYKTPGFWEEYDTCVGGLGVAAPAGCAVAFKVGVVPVCVATGVWTWGSSCALAFAAWAIPCSVVVKCVYLATDDPPKVVRVVAQKSGLCQKSYWWNDKSQGYTLPEYEVMVEFTDDREPKPENPKVKMCAGDVQTVIEVKDCAGQSVTVRVTAPFPGESDWYAYLYEGKPGQFATNYPIEVYGPPVELIPCGKDGQPCCGQAPGQRVPAPECENTLQCQNGKCVKLAGDCKAQYEECIKQKVGGLAIPRITCGMIFNDAWCGKPGYTACATAAYEMYLQCTKEKSIIDCDRELNNNLDTCKK